MSRSGDMNHGTSTLIYLRRSAVDRNPLWAFNFCIKISAVCSNLMSTIGSSKNDVADSGKRYNSWEAATFCFSLFLSVYFLPGHGSLQERWRATFSFVCVFCPLQYSYGSSSTSRTLLSCACTLPSFALEIAMQGQATAQANAVLSWTRSASDPDTFLIAKVKDDEPRPLTSNPFTVQAAGSESGTLTIPFNRAG